MITTISKTFPKNWIYGKYEQAILASIQRQIDKRFPDQNNLLFNTTWREDPEHDVELQQCLADAVPVDNLFVVSTVDYFLPHHERVVREMIQRLSVKKTYFLGNFDTPNPPWTRTNSATIYFNFFAIVCKDHFETYQQDDLVLTDPKYLFISYNRKPYWHRLAFVKKMIEHNVKDLGVVTLGRAFPGDTGPDKDLYFSIGEKNRDYVKYGHWYSDSPEATSHDIPHDLFSLHNMHYWKHHFLHIVGGTSASNFNTFVTQIDFKPIIGLRPFLINGQTQNYKFWEDQGFRTFNHYFPELNLVQSLSYDKNTLHATLVNAIRQLSTLSSSELLDMYNQMLPDLIHNRERWYAWADEQSYRIEHLFDE
jgi:hypothetical protein